MTPARMQRIEALFHAALAHPPTERASFLRRECGNDEGLRLEVESVLAEESKECVLDRPAFDRDALHLTGPDFLTATMHVPLNTGAQLGPWRIESKLGSGGMADVYCAQDTRPNMHRRVAIKIVKEAFSGWLGREVRAIASLNHPHICTLYDVGPNYIVMELIEGVTLASVLKKGAIPLELTCRYGSQIAAALAEAHRQNIVHRDLKPGNIMLTRHGIKVLDFGLAKSPGDDRITGTNVAAGTPAYMAPEQRAGGTCDARTDIFALGLVLYEMATARLLTPNEAPATDGLPAPFVHVVNRCLALDPAERWQAASDVKLELDWAAASPPPVPEQFVKHSPPWAWALAGFVVSCLCLIGVALLLRGYSEATPLTYRTSVLLPPDTPLYRVRSERIALSPDGKFLAIATEKQLWLRTLDSDSAKPIPGTENAFAPFWSPDSRHLGFFAHRKLMTVDLTGVPPVALADAGSRSSGGSWNQDNVIVFASSNHFLQRISAAGGTPVAVTALDPSQGDRDHDDPFFLPDGRHFLYLAVGSKSGSPYESRAILLGSLTSLQPKLVLTGGSNAKFAQGRLLYLRRGALIAQPFDVENARLTGDPAVLAEQVQTEAIMDEQRGVFSVAGNLLAWQSGDSEPRKRLLWFDRSGKNLGPLGEEARYSSPVLSPDGAQVAVSIGEQTSGTRDVWIFDVARRIRTRLTNGAKEVHALVWSPDGKQVVFRAARNNGFDLYQIAASSLGGEQSLTTDGQSKYPESWSVDGRYIAYQSGMSTPRTGPDIWILPLFGDHKSGDRKAFPFLQTTFAETDAHFSPDAHMLAYASDESGRTEVYVTTFPQPGAKWRISTEGGTNPHWRRDGGEIVYAAPHGVITAVTVKAKGATLEVGPPHPLFQVPAESRAWDMSADAQRFLLNTVVQDTTELPITLMQNWTAPR